MQVEGGGFGLAVPPDVSEEEAAQRAGAIGESLVRARVSDAAPLEARMALTTVNLNLREGPATEHDIVRALMQGTIVVALHGEIDGRTSEPGGRGHWSWVAASDEGTGWSSSRFLRDYDGRIPSLGDFRAERRDAVRRATAPVRIVHPDGTELVARRLDAGWSITASARR